MLKNTCEEQHACLLGRGLILCGNDVCHLVTSIHHQPWWHQSPLKSWNWLMHTMRTILWGLHHIQGLSLHQLRQPDHHIFLQWLKWYTYPSYLFATTMAILPTKLWVQHSFQRFLLWVLWKRGTLWSCVFCQVLGTKLTSITKVKSASIFQCPSTKSQGTSTVHLGFPHQG
jgi:hypothetical protein